MENKSSQQDHGLGKGVVVLKSDGKSKKKVGESVLKGTLEIF